MRKRGGLFVAGLVIGLVIGACVVVRGPLPTVRAQEPGEIARLRAELRAEISRLDQRIVLRQAACLKGQTALGNRIVLRQGACLRGAIDLGKRIEVLETVAGIRRKPAGGRR